MKFRTVLVGLCALTLLALPAPPAQAAAPRIAIECGMTVTHDAFLYLTSDRYCRDGVTITRDWEGGGRAPRVTVDLQGHTLRGAGEGVGIGGAEAEDIHVMNGRVENWQYGVAGDSVVRVTRVKFVGNINGLFCNGTCSADLTYFKGNTVGMNVAGEANGFVRRSIFSRNQTGATVGFPQSLIIERSIFFKNRIGVFCACAQLSIAHSMFLKNRVGVRVLPDWPGCADLYRVKFRRNGTDVDGPVC